MKSFNILTNDPSITAWGWAVLNIGGEVLETGCIRTAPDNTKKNLRKTDDRFRRISEINRELLRVIRKYKICYILAEAPHGSQSAVAAVMIGMVAGMIQTISDVLDIPVEYYSEGQVKQSVYGRRAGSKNDMVEAVFKQIQLKPTMVKYKDEAVADAIGVYLTAKNTSEVLRLMKRNLK